MAVDKVFGVWLSGPNCSDLKKEKKYAVGIMEVRGPTFVGGTFKARQHMKKFDLKSCDGLKLLIQFLKDGNGAPRSRRREDSSSPQSR